jgi:hypothetical protein
MINSNNIKFIEALRRGEHKCFKCKHPRYEHGIGHNGGSCAVRINIKFFNRCSCKEFVPSDNLDYIEYLAKKRGLLGK